MHGQWVVAHMHTHLLSPKNARMRLRRQCADISSLATSAAAPFRVPFSILATPSSSDLLA